MTQRAAQFYIDGTVGGESGRHTVIGRCGDVPIRVGDTFTQSYVEAMPVPVAEELGAPRGRAHVRPVQLRVAEIHAYNRSLSELGQGMTGSLALEGAGAAEATPGRLLGDVVSHAETREPGFVTGQAGAIPTAWAGPSSRQSRKAPRK